MHTHIERFWHVHGEKIAVGAVILSLMAGLFMLSAKRSIRKMDYPGPELLWGYGNDTETDCNNNVDDDADGATDCADADDCADDVNCQ